MNMLNEDEQRKQAADLVTKFMYAMNEVLQKHDHDLSQFQVEKVIVDTCTNFIVAYFRIVYESFTPQERSEVVQSITSRITKQVNMLLEHYNKDKGELV